MINKLIPLAVALFFTVTTASTSLAVSIKCEVTSVDGATVIFDCGSKTIKLKKDDKTTVKTKRKKSLVAANKENTDEKYWI